MIVTLGFFFFSFLSSLFSFISFFSSFFYLDIPLERDGICLDYDTETIKCGFGSNWEEELVMRSR